MLKVKQIVPILIDDYPWHQDLKDSIVPLLENYPDKQNRVTNVKATMTEWEWGTDNPKVHRLQIYLLNEIKKFFSIGCYNDNGRNADPEGMRLVNFWANIYNKGDYADSHNHRPAYYSFVYFLKTKWYNSSLVFSDSGQKVRPKEGRYVIFSAQTFHHVPKHKFDDTRITLAGNYIVSEKSYSGGLG